MKIDYGFTDIFNSVIDIQIGDDTLFNLFDLVWIIPLGLLFLGAVIFSVYFFYLFPEQLVFWIPIWIIAFFVGFLL